MSDSRFAVVGPGGLGLRLAWGLNETNWTCVATRGRRPLAAQDREALPQAIVSDTWDQPGSWNPPPVLFLCVPDRELASAARQIAASFDLTDRIVLHTSGMHTADILEPCRQKGAAVASWHPLTCFPPDHRSTVDWDGVWCATEGDPTATARGFTIAHALGLRPWLIEAEKKPLYHAAAAVAANLPHILVCAAADLLSGCGIATTVGDNPLRPLVEASIQSALESPAMKSLTGPIARGDRETIEAHLAVLPPDLARAYESLIERAIRTRETKHSGSTAPRGEQ